MFGKWKCENSDDGDEEMGGVEEVMLDKIVVWVLCD